MAHGASSLDFEIRAWLLNKDYFQVQSDLTVAVNRALADANIEIPFPQRDLHLRSVDGEALRALKGKDTSPAAVNEKPGTRNEEREE